MRETDEQLALPTVVLISGYGRSGSTLLDMLLASRLSGVFGAGELVNLFAELQEGARCECGQVVTACPVWSRVAAVLDELSVSAAAAQSTTWRGNAILGRAGPAYARLWRRLLVRLSAVTDARVIIDSSKVTRSRFRHGLNLHALGIRLIVLHLVRDPADVVASLRKGGNRALERGEPTGGAAHVLRGVLGWLIGNLGTEFLVWRAGAERRMLRYEDLMESEVYCQELVEWVAGRCGVAPNGSTGATLTRGHGVSGNRIRRSGPGPVEMRLIHAPPPTHALDRVSARVLRLIGAALGYYPSGTSGGLKNTRR